MADIGHNNPPVTAQGEDLLEAFARMPAYMETWENAGAAVLLAKQMRMEIDGLEGLRKLAGAPHRYAQAVAEKPTKDVVGKLEAARATVMQRLDDYRRVCGVTEITSPYGPRAYLKTSLAYEIIDQSLLPPDFLIVSPSDALIRAALAEGRAIPGVQRLPDREQLIVS